MLITEKNKRLNLDFDKDNKLDICAWKDIYGTHLKVGEVVYGDFPKDIKKVEDFFYEMTIDEMDEEYFLSVMKNLWG